MDQAGSFFGVEFVRDWAEASLRWGDGGCATVFQHKHWLDAWYRSFDSTPLIAFIVAADTRRDIALVPLMCGRRGRARVVEFADLGRSDYNAPILASDAPRDSASLHIITSVFLSALRRLPERPDLINLEKMPPEIRGRPNPLAAAERATPCSVNGNLVELGDCFEDYRASMAKIQLPRRWRVFTRHRGARFEMAADIDEALRILDVMDRQQNKRMKELSEKFVLDEPRNAKFYRDVVRRGLKDGYAVVSALICGDEVVATTLGLRHGAQYSLLRNTNARRAMVELLARSALHRTDDGGPAPARRAALRSRHRRSRLQAAFRRQTALLDGSPPRTVLARHAPRAARPHRAGAEAASSTRFRRGQAAVDPVAFLDSSLIFFDRPRLADATPSNAPVSTSFRFSDSSS